MSAETLALLSLISYIAAGVCLAAAIVFWFVYRIPSVIGDLSGRTARKSIEKLRTYNEKTGSKPFRAGEVNARRGKETVPEPKPAARPKAGAAKPIPPETRLVEGNKASARDISDQTELLSDNETASLYEGGDATQLLADSHRPLQRHSGGKELKLVEEVILTHTDEVIG